MLRSLRGAFAPVAVLRGVLADLRTPRDVRYD
jgi:hypothetical protein